MLFTCALISLLYIIGQCQSLLEPIDLDNNQKITNCVIKILDKYFAERNELTYVDMNPTNNDILKMIHLTMHFALIAREPTTPILSASNQGYIVLSPDVYTFTEYFDELIREPLWNPYARFLIVIESVQDIELRSVFNVLLQQHVNEVIVVNGTNEGHLYTYNPFEKYACGRYYDKVIDYGLCAETTQDLYPNKLVNGLKNCTFRASPTHRPPFSIDPTKNEYRYNITGMEQYVLDTVSKSDGFNIDFQFNNNGSSFPTVAPNMTAVGALLMVQKNETDVLFGAMMLLASRAVAFSYLYGYHDYVDELRFAVRKASFLPTWQYFYLEFDIYVWGLLLIFFAIYSLIMMYFLRKKDKGQVILLLLDNLILHGRHIRTRMTVKCIFIIWVWFAYLVNTFYQSSLVSITTNPGKEYQISDEDDMAKFNIRPCIGRVFASYLFSEPNKKAQFNRVKIDNAACEDIIPAMKLVSNNKDMYTLIPSYFYLYNKQAFNDQWGDPLIYYFERPYTKLLLSYYFYKGFPLSSRFRMNMLRMRESGLAEKNLRDQYYLRSIKFSFSKKEFQSRFVFPWCVYAAGSLLATVTFFIELIIKYSHRRRCGRCLLLKIFIKK